MEDLEPFYPERMASRILGMGDIATFLEKAQVRRNAIRGHGQREYAIEDGIGGSIVERIS